MKKCCSLFLKGKLRHEVLIVLALFSDLQANRRDKYRLLKPIILFLQNIKLPLQMFSWVLHLNFSVIDVPQVESLPNHYLSHEKAYSFALRPSCIKILQLLHPIPRDDLSPEAANPSIAELFLTQPFDVTGPLSGTEPQHTLASHLLPGFLFPALQNQTLLCSATVGTQYPRSFKPCRILDDTLSLKLGNEPG